MNTTLKNHCDICNKTILGSSYKFKSHMYQHKSVKSRFKCPYCSKEYYRTDQYAKHVSMHTGIAKNKKDYICDYCARGFAEKRNLIFHLKIHDDQYFFKYQCMACGVNYCEERLLKYHIRKTHFNLHEKKNKHLKKQLNETWVERVKESEVCVEMTKVTDNVISIKKVDTIKKEADKQEKKVEQEDTDGKTKFNQYMNSVFAHKDCSQYSKATCDYCKKEMLKKSLLNHIRERHLKLKGFKCQDCKVSFSRHYQLVDHICGKTKYSRRRL